MGPDGWLRRLGPWVGIGTSPAALMTGGGMAEGLRGGELVAAIVVGVALLTVLAVVQGMLGQRTGAPLAALTAGPLGREGSRLTASVVMLAMMLGWFGVNAGVAGVALARLAGIPDVAGVILLTIAMLGIVALGLSVLSWSALVAGIATATLAAYGLHLALADHDATLSGGHTATDPIGFLPAVTLVIGYGAAFSLRTPDFTHDLARPRHVVWCALTGLAAPVLAFALAGAVLQAATGEWDLADVLRGLGSSNVAYLFVAVGFTGSILTNLWSGALSLQDAAPRVTHRGALLTVAAVGAVLAAAGFDDLMLSWLTVMALAAPGLVAVCVIHAARRERVEDGWRAAGLAAWGGGFACGLGLYLAGSPLALPAATLVPALVYWLSRRRGERDLVDATQGG
jgi:cytosine permease